MSKKLYIYIIRLFIGPFLEIFSILFFIFIIQFFWSKLNDFTGKGLNSFIILKLLFYFGLSLVPLVTPIAVLLTCIMTYGTLGERYELAAMKSTGISLWQMMKPLFLVMTSLAVGLYFFSDHVVPEAQKKGGNLAYNISRTQPALNIITGTFIQSIPNILMKIDKKTGKDKEQLEGVFIQYGKSVYEAQNTILAKRGLLKPAENPRYIRLKLFNGTVYREDRSQQKYDEQQRQPYQIIKFDTLIQNIETPSLIDQNIEKENFKDSYSMLNTQKLIKQIHTIKKESEKDCSKFQKQSYMNLFPKDPILKEKKNVDTPGKDFNHLSPIEKKQVLEAAKMRLKSFREMLLAQKKLVQEKKKYLATHELELYRKFSFSITCIVMFFIGAPLGAIIRKGGMGLSLIIALIIFITYYTILTISQNVAEKGLISSWLGAWLPNIIMLPIGLWITYKTVNDAPVIRLSLYTRPLEKTCRKNKKKRKSIKNTNKNHEKHNHTIRSH
ncbi:MAG: LptF/LptG family permease [Flavobacteriales bacterium Tduv]